MEMQRWNMRVFAPVLIELSTYSGPSSGGNTIIINGDNFPETYTSSSYSNVFLEIDFGGNLATNVIVKSSIELSCIVPAGSSGTSIPVSINLNVRGYIISSNNTITYQYL